MIVIIQCAATKRSGAGYFRAKSGEQVLFVADPQEAPPVEDRTYGRPDGMGDEGLSWRDLVLRYNDAPGNNRFGLVPAFELYENDTYRRLVQKFGIEHTFILSAGWGLIGASFLTPQYDITFSPSAESYKRRRRGDTYRDLCMLPTDSNEPILFFGGKDYVPLFAALTGSIRARKTVFFNSDTPPIAPGCSLTRFKTSTRTNWHYECANAFIAGTFGVE